MLMHVQTAQCGFFVFGLCPKHFEKRILLTNIVSKDASHHLRAHEGARGDNTNIRHSLNGFSAYPYGHLHEKVIR